MTLHVCLISCHFVVQGSRQVVQERAPTPESPDNSIKHESDEDETLMTSAKKRASSGKNRVSISNHCSCFTHFYPVVVLMLMFCCSVLWLFYFEIGSCFLVDQFFQLITVMKSIVVIASKYQITIYCNMFSASILVLHFSYETEPTNLEN